VDEVVALDPQGNVLDFGTEYGQVHNLMNDEECALAYLNVQPKFPSQILVPKQRDFPESSAPAGVSIGAFGPTGLEASEEE
jgi:hypothetical protein